MINALILIPGAYLATAAAMCADYCVRRGYQVTGYSGDPKGALAMYLDGLVDAIVIARPDDNPCQAIRVETVLTEEGPAGPPPHNSGISRHGRRRRPNQV